MTSALIRPSKSAITFAEFRFDDVAAPTFLRVSDAESPRAVEGNDYFPEPAIDFELGEQTGGLDDKPFQIKVPTNRGVFADIDSFAQALAAPTPHSPVRVRVFEILDSSVPSEQRICYLCEGVLANRKANPDGIRGLVQLEFLPSKALLENVKLGIPALAQCWATFGGNGCYVPINQFFDGGTYYPNHSAQIRRVHVELRAFGAGGPSAYRSQAVTLTMNPTLHPGADQRTLTQQPKGWWLGAYLLRNGLSIPIRDWWFNDTLAAGTNQFVLGRMPPKSWLWDPTANNTIVLVPGCAKTREACHARNNDRFFGGLGYGMPAYNPMLDLDNR